MGRELCFEINGLGTEARLDAVPQSLICNIMQPQWCSSLHAYKKREGCGLSDRLLKEMRDLPQLRSDLHTEGIRSALIGMMEGLLHDRMLASSIAYSASYNGEDIRKLFLHVLNSFSATHETSAGQARNT